LLRSGASSAIGTSPFWRGHYPGCGPRA